MARGKALNFMVFGNFCAPLALVVGAVAPGALLEVAAAQASPEAAVDLTARFGTLKARRDLSLSPDRHNAAGPTDVGIAALAVAFVRPE